MKKEKFTETDKEIMEKIGKRMKELRIKANYKSSELFAYEQGISRAQYGRYESGTNITVVSLTKILTALNVTFEEFFQGFDKP